MSKPYVIGIDMGGTNTVFGIVDARGTVIASNSIKTAKHSDINDYIDELYQEINRLIVANEKHYASEHTLIVGEVVQHAASLVALISSHSIVGLFAAKPVEESSDGGKIVARKRLYVVVGVGVEKFVHVVSLLLHLVSGKGSELVGAVDVVAPVAQLGNFRGIESTEVVDALLGDG